MPLELKNKPPYYETVPEQKFRIYANTTRVETEGTNETNLYEWEILANTLKKNGDGIIVTFLAEQQESGVQHVTRLYLDGQGISSINESENSDIVYEARIIRKTNKIYHYVAQMWGTNEYGTPRQMNEWTLTGFNKPLPMKITGQCTGNGKIIGVTVTVDKFTT
jgi:hypothetical protein